MAADIRPFIADAQRLQKETGIPASITLGQIIFESSGSYAGGLSGLAAQGKNLFGIKGKGTAGSVTMPTTEYTSSGSAYKTSAAFRAYNTYYESMADHARLLQTDRYSKYLKNAKTAEDFAKGILAGGYATDPNYANLLMNIINKNGLAKYDDGTPYTGTSGGTASTEKGIGTALTYGIIRSALLLIFFIAAVLFFAKAFPVVETTIRGN